MDALEELIDLLTFRQLDAEGVAKRTQEVRGAMDDPDLDWIDDPLDRLQFGVRAHLHEWIAASDRIDELHEQISADFAEPLPPFPERYRARGSTYDYFRWVDGVLAELEPACDMLLWDSRYDEDWFVFVVYRADTARILDLTRQLGLAATRVVENVTGRPVVRARDVVSSSPVSAMPIDDGPDVERRRREALQAIALEAGSIRLCARCGPILTGALPRPDVYLDGVMTNAILLAHNAYAERRYRDLFPKALQIQEAMRAFLFSLGGVACDCE